jgi:hypothetical protein
MMLHLDRTKILRRLGLAKSHDRVERKRHARNFRQSLESLEGRTLLALVNPAWVAEGPGPRTGATASVPDQQNSAIGAVNAVVFLNSNTALAASVNGGIWRTTDFTASNPAWTAVSGNLASPSISAIAVSPLTSALPLNQQIVFAGTGATSSYGRVGMATGLFKSTDGGQTWQPTGTLAGSNPATNPFQGSTINSIVPTSYLSSTTDKQVVLVGADNGLWRSNDEGATFTSISSVVGRVTTIVADPSDSTFMTYYASVISTSGQYQVLKSTDRGNSWSPITTLSFPAAGGTLQTALANLKLAVFPGTSSASRALYAGLVTTEFSSSAPVTGTITNITNGTYTVSAPGNNLSNNDWVHVPYTTSNGTNSVWNYQVTVINPGSTFTIRDPAGPVLSLGTLTFTTGNFVGRAIVYQSTNQGDTWQQATVDPTTIESTGSQPLFGANQRRSGIQTSNFAITVDPTNRNIVYVSGATQPANPSSLGNPLWTGRLFRGDFSNAAQTTWTPITDVYAGAGLGPALAATSLNFPAGQRWTITVPTQGLKDGDRIALLRNGVYTYYAVLVMGADTIALRGTRGSGEPQMTSGFTVYQVLGITAPHADSRSLSFSPSGNLVQTDDGGIYVRSSPTSSTGTWSSANGNMSDSELTGIAFDSLNNIIVGGSQDNGLAAQVGANNLQWNALLQADGNIPQVDNLQSMHPGESIYYYSVQNLGAFTRQVRNSSNEILQTVNPALNVAVYGLLVYKVTDPSQIQVTGQNQVVVASFNNILYFRVFNQLGEMIVNKTETDYPNQRDLTTKIRDQFTALTAPGKNPSWSEQQTLVQDVAQLTGFAIRIGQTLGSLSNRSAPFYDTAQFYNPFVVDSVASTTGTMGWLLLGMTNYLYESKDGGEDWTRVGPALPGAPTAMSYGGMLGGVANPSVAYVGVGGNAKHLYLRTRLGGRFNPVDAYTGNTPTAIAVDPDDWMRAYIVDTSGKIWMTTNGGGSFDNITGSITPTSQSLFALAVYDQPVGFGVNESNDDAVFVGGWGGVWAAENPQAGVTWTKFGTNMPNVLVNGLIYNATDNVLLASTLGRGAFDVPNLSASVFQPDNPQPGPPPSINVPGPQSTNSNTPLSFSAKHGNAISIADPGAAATNTFSVTLSVTNGNLTLGTLRGLDAPDDAGASSVKTFQGSLSRINAALDGLSFQSDHFGSPSVLTISVDDQNPAGPMTDTQVVAITDLMGNGTPARSVPRAPTAATSRGPVITAPRVPLTVGINSGSLPINSITLSDPSNTRKPETLTVYVSGGSLIFSNGSTLDDGSLLGPITGTLAKLNGYFRRNATSGFSFTPTPDFQGTAWIMIRLDNGTHSRANPATAWIQINVAAATPTVAAPQNLTTAANTPIAFGSQSALVTVASSDPVSQTLEVIVSAVHGLLALANTTGVTVLAGNPAGDDYLEITGMPAAINSALASMTYTPNPGFRGSDTLSLDVVNTGGWSNISPPPFTDLTDDGGPADNSEDVFPSTAPLTPSPSVNWDASLVTTAISILVGDPPAAVSRPAVRIR